MIERSVSWFYTEWVDADGVVRFTHDAVRRIYTDTGTVYSGYTLMDARVEVDRYESNS